MVAVQSDWGDPGFAGDYPALSTGTAPSAPGKRAKRTFNKQQHALQQLVAETVVLQPRCSAGGQSGKPPLRLQSPTAGSKQAASTESKPEKHVSPNKKRKRKTTEATVPAEQQAPGAAAGINTGHTGAARATRNGTAASAQSEPVKPKRQRNKFKADLAEGAALVPVVAGPNAAHAAAEVDAQRSAQPRTDAAPAVSTNKQRKGKKRSQQTDTKAVTTAADGILAQAETSSADATHDEVQPHSLIRSKSATVADEDSARARASDGSAKVGRKQNKAGKQGRTARADSFAAAVCPSQDDCKQPEAALGVAAAANGTAVQIEASSAHVPNTKRRRLAAADADTPASRPRVAAAQHADGSEWSQEPSARHTGGAKPVRSCDQRMLHTAPESALLSRTLAVHAEPKVWPGQNPERNV